MKSDPLVCVIIPVYNRYNLLLEAVESVLSQSFADFSLSIVDDGSTDSLLGPLGELDNLLQDKRISILRINHTGLPGLVRNAGAETSKGKYLAFLDSDDLWDHDKLQKQVDFFRQNPDFKICHTRELWLRDGKEISQAGQKHRREGMIFEDALKKCIIGPSTVMITRDLFVETGGFREDMEIAEDYEYWLRITSGYPVGYIDSPLTIKRAGHGDQLSEKYGHIEYFRIQGLKELVDRSVFPPPKDLAARKELSGKCRIYALGARKRGKAKEGALFEELSDLYSKPFRFVD